MPTGSVPVSALLAKDSTLQRQTPLLHTRPIAIHSHYALEVSKGTVCSWDASAQLTGLQAEIRESCEAAVCMRKGATQGVPPQVQHAVETAPDSHHTRHADDINSAVMRT